MMGEQECGGRNVLQDGKCTIYIAKSRDCAQLMLIRTEINKMSLIH